MAADAATITRWRRAGYAAQSGLAGWFAGQLLCLPVNLITAVRDSEGQARLLVETFLTGLLVWGGWTFFLALVAWLLLAVPLVMTIRPCLLVRLRRVILVAAPSLALAPAIGRMLIYRNPAKNSMLRDLVDVVPYGVFGCTFALVTAAVYILLSKRRMDQAELVS